MIRGFLPSRFSNSNGITVVGLVAFIVCFIIVLIVTLTILRAGKRAAYEITAKHDLRQFVKAEQEYYAENDEYIGEEGDVISSDPDISVDFDVEGFIPSEGVVITVISDAPLIVTSRHTKADAVFEYNFEEKIIKKTGDKNGK